MFYLFSNDFTKKMQSNLLTLMKMSADVKSVIASLDKLKNQSIPIGFEDKLQAQIVVNGEKHFLNDIELESIMTGRKAAK